MFCQVYQEEASLEQQSSTTSLQTYSMHQIDLNEQEIITEYAVDKTLFHGQDEHSLYSSNSQAGKVPNTSIHGVNWPAKALFNILRLMIFFS